MKGVRTIVLSLVALGALGAGALVAWRAWAHLNASQAGAPLVVHAVAERRDMLITVDETGMLEATDSTAVVPAIRGVLVWICENGMAVAEGEPVALLDPTLAQQEVVEATARLDQAARRLEQARERGRSRVTEAELRLRTQREQAQAFAREQQERLREMSDRIVHQERELEIRRPEAAAKERMAAQGLIAGTEVEREQAALRAAEFALQRDRSSYELEKSRVEAQVLERRKQVDNAEHDLMLARRQAEREVRMAQNQVDSLELRLQRSRGDLHKTAIAAPRAGVLVLSQLGGRMGSGDLPRVGDRISEGRELAQVVSLEHMQVRLELDQTRVTNIRVGQEVMISVDALPGEAFAGKVKEMGATARRPPIEGWRGFATEMTFPVTIEMSGAPHALMRPGMRANVSIVTRRIQDVVVVPSESVFERDGAPVVFVETAGGYQRMGVTLGQSSGDHTIITHGLRGDEKLALNDPEASTGRAASAVQERAPAAAPSTAAVTASAPGGGRR